MAIYGLAAAADPTVPGADLAQPALTGSGFSRAVLERSAADLKADELLAGGEPSDALVATPRQPRPGARRRSRHCSSRGLTDDTILADLHGVTSHGPARWHVCEAGAAHRVPRPPATRRPPARPGRCHRLHHRPPLEGPRPPATADAARPSATFRPRKVALGSHTADRRACALENAPRDGASTGSTPAHMARAPTPSCTNARRTQRVPLAREEQLSTHPRAGNGAEEN